MRRGHYNKKGCGYEVCDDPSRQLCASAVVAVSHAAPNLHLGAEQEPIHRPATSAHQRRNVPVK